MADTLAGVPWADRIADGAHMLGLALEPAMLRQLAGYLALLQRWNRVYNLTALRDPEEMLTHHLFDSLAVVRPLLRHWHATRDAACAPGKMPPLRLLDVGSGAGLPGVVVATCMPDATVTCVDAVAKKTAFIQQVAAELRLPNLRAEHARVEVLSPLQHQFDVVCSRAFASLADFTTLSAPVLAPTGCWMAMKGRHPAEELAGLRQDVQVFHVEQMVVPSLDAERCLVWMRKSGAALSN